jgi:Zn finger protein HypA/HybF involved in hydrogenase expression
MFNNAQKAVRCGKCMKYFVHTKKDTKCPFCHTEYDEAEEKSKDKKTATKTPKTSFKMWGVVKDS